VQKFLQRLGRGIGILLLGAGLLVAAQAEGELRESSTVDSTEKSQKMESMDELIRRYKAASKAKAYQVMNQIKKQIAAMNRELQQEAISKMRAAVEEKSIAMQAQAQKQKSKTSTTRSSRSKATHPVKTRAIKSAKRAKSVHKRAHSARKKSRHHSSTHTSKNPLDVLSGSGSTSGGVAAGIGAAMGDFGGFGGMGGGIGGGMGGMGGGMGGF